MRLIEEKNKMSQEEVQEKALLLSKDNPYIILQYATGVGKSCAMIKILENILINNPRERPVYLFTSNGGISIPPVL